MPIPIESRRGRAALMAAHCVGMVDLVALPIWVGTLIAHYRLDPQKAGMLATLFLAGMVVASVLVAPRLQRLSGRAVAALGFGAAAAGFLAASTAADFSTLAILHLAAGLANGAALSVTHGTIARSARPHRLFAIASISLGVFGVAFLAVTPQVIGKIGGTGLFLAFAAVMAAAAAISLLAFPSPDTAGRIALPTAPASPLPASVWLGIAGIACMTIVQAMTFSFLERVGSDRGFERQAINAMLIALGLVSLLPPALAALLEKRWNARTVLLLGPVLQAILCALIMTATTFPAYAVAASVFPGVMIFVHTFAFGLIAKLDPSGRALAGTPAMIMTGSAIGPLFGGSLVKAFGYGSLGIAAAILATIAVFCFSRLPASTPPGVSQGALA